MKFGLRHSYFPATFFGPMMDLFKYASDKIDATMYPKNLNHKPEHCAALAPID